MSIIVKTFSLVKFGNKLDEYDDAFYPKTEGIIEEKVSRFAIADGATQSLLSGKWAEFLVKEFCESNSPQVPFESFLEQAYASWDKWQEDYLKEREMRNKPIQWYEEPGLQAGAFSTFLGLRLTLAEDDQSGEWEATAVGDSCLFHVRGGGLIGKFPIENSVQFNNHPPLICSNPNRNKDPLNEKKEGNASFCLEDRFYLMTDALACWFLQEQEESGKLPCNLDSVETESEFKKQIYQLRNKNGLLNDDVTLIRIDIG